MLISKFDNSNIEEHIKEFESKYNFTFPKQYREFLLKYNGGETPKSKFRINRISSDIRGFYGLGGANQYHHYNLFENSGRLTEWIEDSMIPIAVNTFGDYIMIGIGEDNQGKVYFYYHDRPKKYLELTDDLRTFIKKCKSEKIGHIMTIEERKELLIENGNEENITPGWIKVWQEEIDRYKNIHQEELIID